MSAWQIVLGTLASGALAGIGVAGYHLALEGWRKLEEIKTSVARERNERALLEQSLQTGQLTIARQQWSLEKDRIDRMRTIYPQADRYPLLAMDSNTVLDVERGVLFGIQSGVLNISPAIVIPEQRRRLIKAMAGLGAPGQRAALEGESLQEADLPDRVPARWAMQQLGRPSFSNLALGVAMQNGQPELVRGDMGRLVHVAIGGSSGYGKSAFARWLAYQLAIAGDADLAMVDLELATFAPFAQCGRLLWPVADTEADALSIFDALMDEMEKRKALYSEYPGVDSLATYNTTSGDALRPLVCLVDEATALLASKDVNVALRTLALRSRKYGVWLILFGQDWRGASLDIAIRNQLSARLSFKTMSKSQSHVLLGCPDAYDLDGSKPGRAVAVLPGRGKTTLQTPLLSREDILAAMTGDGPRCAMPEPEPTEADVQAETIREMHESGMSQSEIERQVFGYTGGKAYAAVKAALSDNGAS